MRWWVTLAVAVAGCEEKQQGSPAEPRERETEGGAGTTTPGSAGEDTATEEAEGGSGFRWYDQTGEPVTTGSELVWWDEDGRLWQLDMETGDGYALPAPLAYYSEASCYGEAWLVGIVPAVVYEDEGRMFARSADQVGEAVTAASYQFQLGVTVACFDEPAEVVGVRAASLVTVDSAPPDFEGPLYPGPVR